MGLPEKRKQKEITDNELPKFVTEMKTVTGSNIDAEVDWPTFESESSLNGFVEAMPRIMKALKEICTDDIGKEALAGSLKKIKVQCTSSVGQWPEWESGTLLLKHCYHGEGLDQDKVRRTIEENLE